MSQGSGRVLNKNIKHKCGSIVMLHGKISITATTGAVSAYDSNLDLASVVAGAGGLYTLTLNDKFAELISCHVTVQAASAVDCVCQIRSHDVVSEKTIVLDLLKAAVSTEAEADLVLHICIMSRDTSVSR
jgi:hypothetical protein